MGDESVELAIPDLTPCTWSLTRGPNGIESM